VPITDGMAPVVSSSPARRLWPFAALAVLGLLLAWLPGQPVRHGFWLAAAALTLVLAVSALRVPWARLPPTTHLIPALVYLVVVGLLRHAVGGANGGMGSLVLLPVVWMALYGTRAQLLVVLAGVALVWTLPLLLIGGPTYPAPGWRACALTVSLSGMIGTTVQRLVARVRLQAAALRARDQERQALLDQLEALALSDPLTGLCNRRAWTERVQGTFGARDGSRRVCVAVLDLDKFKELNDSRGHQAGDQALKATAAAWQAELRPGDVLARFGGDEFALLLPDCPLPNALRVVDRLRAATRSGLSCSAGVAEWDGRETLAELQHRADALLYEAKRAGRDRTAAAPLG
jgi:diguanylate cyclase (GGDEF)-like protein